MTTKVTFAISPQPKLQPTLGTFEMDTVPDVGETVELAGKSYEVTARAWKVTRTTTRVDVTVR